ncbi:hypothetical protein Pse7367_3826 (plasmid) [Thalassoporum mexicanum PCC 7367]|uniref:hypothetical protein n=1 Tax=Thalassoporum mexicanum TaxID=3457544 RepID=UPI00029FF8CC|nr:hypothetical protein [Pseudanabaena sp. PCC 7367]AFY72049.1 hypothetical protein Pse7367_3826 [Pseudanabaena sp. PCC 7367]
MDDDRRAQELKKYLLDILIGIPGLSADSIGHVLFGLPLREERTKNEGRKAHIKLQTVSELVNGLTHVLQAIEEQPDLFLSNQKNQKVKPNAQKPSREDILRAFHMQSQLTWEEREQLGLRAGDDDILVQQALLNLALYPGQHRKQQIIDLYKASIGADFSESPSEPITSLDDVDGCINKFFELRLQEHKLLIGKVKNAITRLLLQAGTGQMRFISFNDQDQYVKRFLPHAFVERFTQVVVDNNLLNQELPVYIQGITINHLGPLPVPIHKGNKAQGVFHKELLELHFPQYEPLHTPIDTIFEQLLSRKTSEAEVEFYVRIKEEDNDDQNNKNRSYTPFSKRVYEKLKTQVEGKSRIHFTIKSSGLGGTLSQVIRVINKALFWGINCLQDDYFPIAHDVLIHQDIIQNNVPSAVWSHCLVKLCRYETIEKALTASYQPLQKKGESNPINISNESYYMGIRSYEEFTFIDPIGRGDYCHFDVLASAAKAALQARLRAVNLTGIPSQTYVHDLLHRVEQQYIIDEAKALVTGYPFSSFAMESWLRTELLPDKVKVDVKSFSYATFDAYLTITETFLTEGSYRSAFKYLDVLKRLLDHISKSWVYWCDKYETQYSRYNDMEKYAFSGSLLVRYELCLAEYFYVLDWQSELASEQTHYFLADEQLRDTKDCLGNAWQALDRAEQLLTVRLAKYYVIHEVSQATFAPYYKLLSKIYLLRAKMLLFFPTAAGTVNPVYKLPTDSKRIANRTEPKHIHGGRLFLLERARLYAACNGDDELYVICTAYQCLALLMASFVRDGFTIDAANQLGISMTPGDCRTWAQQRRDHALLRYTATGKRCYHEIKRNSGMSSDLAKEHRIFGRYEIDAVPNIRETIGEHPPGYKKLKLQGEMHDESEVINEFLYLDMRFLMLPRSTVDPDDPQSKQLIYMFGPTSCYLFLIRGLCHLCSNNQTEFGDQSPQLTETNDLDLNDWDKKLEECYRLFTYAWAIADDGGVIEQMATEEGKWRIRRYTEARNKATHDLHATSIRDLYPYRVTDIADLGKVFAAICATLRIYTQSNAQERHHEIAWLFNGLKGQESFQKDNSLGQALKGQRRYNGHLATYLDKCQAKIKEAAQNAQYNAASILEERDSLVSDIFELTACAHETDPC